MVFKLPNLYLSHLWHTLFILFSNCTYLIRAGIRKRAGVSRERYGISYNFWHWDAEMSLDILGGEWWTEQYDYFSVPLCLARCRMLTPDSSLYISLMSLKHHHLWMSHPQAHREDHHFPSLNADYCDFFFRRFYLIHRSPWNSFYHKRCFKSLLAPLTNYIASCLPSSVGKKTPLLSVFGWWKMNGFVDKVARKKNTGCIEAT